MSAIKNRDWENRRHSDEDGMYYAQGGIADVDTKFHVKYTKEGRFSFGVDAVMLHDGTLEGRRCRTFDYSAKNLIIITAEEKMIRDEIQRVGSLKTGGQWIKKRSRLLDVLFEDDCITTMTDIAETTKAKYAKHNIIKTVLDMKMMAAAEVTEIIKDKEFRVPEHKLRKWQDASRHAKEGSVPAHVMKDHRKDIDTYLLRFGPTWKDPQMCHHGGKYIYIKNGTKWTD
jgi:hypothetical protein